MDDVKELRQPKGIETREVGGISPGVVVQEIGSARLMTVRAQDEQGVMCDWFDEDGHHQEGTFAYGALRVVRGRGEREFIPTDPLPVEQRIATTLDEGLVEAIACVCHEANRAYCAVVMGDDSQKPWLDAPAWQREGSRNGVRGILAGDIRHPMDAHVAWMKEKVEQGWVYGETKDAEAKTHPCIVEYDALPQLQRYKDHLFFAIVQALSKDIG